MVECSTFFTFTINKLQPYAEHIGKRLRKCERVRLRIWKYACAYCCNFVHKIHNFKAKNSCIFEWKSPQHDVSPRNWIVFGKSFLTGIRSGTQARSSNELRKTGVFASISYVRSIWLRHNLENLKKGLKALENKIANDSGLVLTQA